MKAEADDRPALVVQDLHAAYGLSQVLFGLSFVAGAGQVVALLGRNGVGKTTTLRCLAGLIPPQRGRLSWAGRNIAALPPHRIARLGLGSVPEERRIFADLTVWENLDIARRPPAAGPGWDEERVFDLFADLKPLANRQGGLLSGGQQQMLAVARALMGNPRLLLLDEASEGLSPQLRQTLRAQLQQLKEEGLGMVLAEQNLDFALALSDQVHILEKGQIKYTGTPEQLRAQPEILQQYLAL